MAEEIEGLVEKKGGNKKKLFILLILVLVILGVGGGAAYKFMVLDKEASKENKAEKIVEEIKKVEDLGIQFEIGTFVVNLIDKDADRYLKVAIVLEIQNEQIKQEIEKRLPQIKDAVTTLLFTKRSSDLKSAEGIEVLKEEIIKRINAILPIGGVKNVYFTDFVIQTA